MRYERKPEHDRRIKRWDDFAGDAWLDTATGEIVYGAVGHDRNQLEADEEERAIADYERQMMRGF